MRIANLIQEQTQTDSTSYTTTAVLTPSVNRTYLAVCVNTKASAVDTPTCSGGGGLTWTQLGTIATGAGDQRLTIFRGFGTSGLTSGTITFSCGANTQTGWIVIVDEASEINTNASFNAVRQSATNSGSGTSSSVALASFGNPFNACYNASSMKTNETITAKSGFTKTADLGGTAPQREAAAEYLLSSDTAPTMSWTTSGQWVAGALEIINQVQDTVLSPMLAYDAAQKTGTVLLAGAGTVTPSSAKHALPLLGAGPT